jgi:DNA-binding response OmpR family regulator
MLQVLIVDDDEAMRSVIKDHLSSTYKVIDTGSPEMALSMTLECKPDAILLDLSMPGLSGFELCQLFSSLRVAIDSSHTVEMFSAVDTFFTSHCEPQLDAA